MESQLKQQRDLARYAVYILGIICVGLLWTRFVNERDLATLRASCHYYDNR